MIKTLLVSKNLNFVKYVINNVSNIELHNFSTDIDEALTILDVEQIDLVLLNLSQENTYKFFRCLNNKNYLNSIIVVSNSLILKEKLKNNPYLHDFIYNKELLFETINSFPIKQSDDIIRAKIDTELQYLGYRPSYVGTKYISDIIFIMNQYYPMHGQNIKKDIYPILFEKYNKSYSNIKSNISNATEMMYYECDEEKLTAYLNRPAHYSKPKPTDIISTVLNKIRKG